MNDAPASSSWTVERDSDSVAWLIIDKPGSSANVLSSGVLRELDAVLEPLARNPPRAVIVISGKKSGFIAGADIK
jgi:3-hydroxyacyl-CoA dehydrogenase / enoyl-CoA hydratase / 3-hydroxybutyryl-CoA epimerase